MNHTNKKNYFEEYVKINGREEYFLHLKSANEENPVMLFLHGGPGIEESIFSYLTEKYFMEYFTIVHYDQIGAGKTLTKNKDIYPSLDLLLEDLKEIIKYLKEKYNKQKIVILGHSWGSVLGTNFVKKYPKDVLCYIGVGQVIDMFENEVTGYNKLKEEIEKNKNVKDLKTLLDIGEYPEKSYSKKFWKKIMRVRSLQQKYRLSTNIKDMLFKAFKSPIFKFSDILSFMQITKYNKELITYLVNFSLYKEDLKYEMPIFYILGENDFQTPYTIAEKYFNTIDAPYKKLFMIKDAGHATDLDNPEHFSLALKEISKYCIKNLSAF